MVMDIQCYAAVDQRNLKNLPSSRDKEPLVMAEPTYSMP